MNSDFSSSFDFSTMGSQADSLTWDVSYTSLQNIDQNATQTAPSANGTASKTPEAKSSKSTKNTSGSVKRSIDKTDQGENQQRQQNPKRPGRKPVEKSEAELSSDPKQKRKAQNRAAQRAFRERKEKYVAELQERIRQLEQENALSEDLVKENEALKEKVRKLQEENYALKGAQFTFEFPIGSSSTTTTTPESKFLPTTSTDSSSSPSNSLDHGNSASSAAESPLYALDQSGGSSSDEGQNQSPQSLEDNNIMEHKTDDKLFGGGTGNMTTGTNLFSPIPASQDLEFLAVPGPGDDGYVAPASFDLFQSKDNLFSDYRVPADNDFWSHTDSLAALFGDDGGDLFGLNGPAPFTQDQEPGAINAFDLSSSNTLQQHQQQQQEQEPFLQTMTPVQRKAYEELQEFKAKSMRLYDVREQFEKHCPDFNIDELCSELKEKANCSMNKDVVTDREINMFLRCF